MKPLVLSFPYPILANQIGATLHRKDRLVDLILKKAVREPWPCEFQVKENCRMIVDRCQPWQEQEGSSSFRNHLRAQFKMSEMMNPTAFFASALDQVRQTINSLFEHSSVNGSEFFGIQRQGAHPIINPDWYIRVHNPILTNPTTGAPVLLLSAVHHRLVGKLVAQGKLNARQNTQDFLRIFPGIEQVVATKKFVTIFTFSQEEDDLIRFVLRLNSTKISASTWQKRNVPLGEASSPWLATFVSPLYLDCEFTLKDLELTKNIDSSAFLRQLEMDVASARSCASCKKISPTLKRCARCRSIVYCSVDCQRSHWLQHKIVCSTKK